MLIDKRDAVALAAIGTLATITTAVLLPKIQAEVKTALEVKDVKKSASKPKKLAAKPGHNSKDFGVEDLVTGTLFAGVVWAITKN